MTKRAFLFPGQGSQKVGMGKMLAQHSAVAKAVFDEVDEALGENLFALMCEGPEDELTLTENAQPAIMAKAIAVLRTLEQRGGFSLADKAVCVAGHSLGEYSALCAAGSLNLTDTARLLRQRGLAMQAAVAPGEGAMAALLGIGFDEALAVAAEASTGGEICEAANDNAPGQVVISGHKAAVERALPLAKEAGARRAMALPVSAPFHCALMQPAADAMAQALTEITITPPSVPLYANMTAASVSEPDAIRTLLVEQVTGMVRWRESVSAMHADGVSHFVELGGAVLIPMVKRIVSDVDTVSIESSEDIDGFLASL